MKKVVLFILLFLGTISFGEAQETGLDINVRVYLEGPLLNNNNETGTSHSRPLMRDNLRQSPFNDNRYIPDSDPYGPWNVSSWEGIEKYNHVLSGALPEFTTIADPDAVFGVTGENAIVDWVFVELRSKLDNTEIIATRSGLVQRDGDVVDLDGSSALEFPAVEVDDYYVVVRHRNHLGAMTAVAKTPAELEDLVDFTKAETGFFDFGTTRFNGAYDYANRSQNNFVKSGYLALYGGDFDGNGKVKYTSPNDDLNTLFGEIVGYEILDENGETVDYNFFTNYQFAFGYHKSDYDMNSKARYDNPNDDKNMAFGTLLFYPLNSNFEVSFDFFIEQIP